MIITRHQFIQERIFSNAPVRQIAIAMNTNSAFTGSYTENTILLLNNLISHKLEYSEEVSQLWCYWLLSPLCYDKEGNELPRWYPLTSNWLLQRPLCTNIWFDFDVRCYKIFFTQNLLENHCGWSWNLVFLYKTLLISLYWQNEHLRLELTRLLLLEKIFKMDNVSLQQTINRIPLPNYRYRGSFPSDYVPTLDNDTFAIIITQPSNMQAEHWIMIAKSCHKLYFADTLGRPSFQQYKQMMPESLQSHPSVFGFYDVYATFHLFKFQQEEITGVHDLNVLNVLSSYM